MLRQQITVPDSLTHYDTVHTMHLLLSVFVTVSGTVEIDMCLIYPTYMGKCVVFLS